MTKPQMDTSHSLTDSESSHYLIASGTVAGNVQKTNTSSSSVTTRSQRNARSNDVNANVRKGHIDNEKFSCNGHQSQLDLVLGNTGLNPDDDGNSTTGVPGFAQERDGRREENGPAVLCVPLHHTTPDTTGSPEGGPPADRAQKRPSEDVDNANDAKAASMQRPRPKRPRRMYTPDQVQVLEKKFQENEYPTAQDRILMSGVTELSTEKVKVWFQNRRSRERRRRQNQLNNEANMKRMSVATVAPAPKAQTTFVPRCAVSRNPHCIPMAKSYPITPATSTAAATRPLPAQSGATQQQWTQVFVQGTRQPLASQQSDPNNNIVMGNPQQSQFLTPMKVDMVGGNTAFSNMYAKLHPTSVQAVRGEAAEKETANPAPKAETYTPLVPAWSQSWPMVPPQSSSSINQQVQKVVPMCSTEGYYDNSKWLENQANNLHTANYGASATNTNTKNFQEHYPYAAMFPPGYLPYGYPYYAPSMYQNPNMGLYPPQQHVQPPPTSCMPSYLGSESAPSKSPYQSVVGQSAVSQSVVSQSVRLALQRKLDNAQKNYQWHQYNQLPTARNVKPYLDSPSKPCDNEALSDSSTLSSPERSGSPIKPLATSSPNIHHQEVCDIPFNMAEKLGGSGGLDNIAMQDMWQQAPGQGTSEAYDKDNNNNMDLITSTPYPNIAGYYNDFTPVTSASYSQPTTTTWGNVRTSNLGDTNTYPYKLPDWSAMPSLDTATAYTNSGDTNSTTKPSSSSCQFTVIEPSLIPSEPLVDPPGQVDLSCKNSYQTPGSGSGDVMHAGRGGASSNAHSDISSYVSGDEEECSEMAPHVQIMSSEQCSETNNQRNQSNSSLVGLESPIRSHPVYDVSDTE